MKKESGQVIYSPSDLIRFLASPFASWLDRYSLENPGALTPDEQTKEEELLSRTGDEHERLILTGYKAAGPVLIEIAKDENDFVAAHKATLAAINNKAAIIYQAALQDGCFAGYAAREFPADVRSSAGSRWHRRMAGQRIASFI